MKGLTGLRVIDLSEGIAGGYAGKLLVDAEAEVWKVERSGGDPLRFWSSTGGEVDGASPLFRYLHHGKQSITRDDASWQDLLDSADAIIDSSSAGLDIESVAHTHPRLVVLSITSYGLLGVHTNYPGSEFVLQAEAGGVAVRGAVDREPVMAGARLGEWLQGMIGAFALVGAWREARRAGRGDFIDLGMMEILYSAAGLSRDAAYFLNGKPPLDTQPVSRYLETPSIEQASDGWVAFCTNSRQQFDSFLILIERPDLLGDDDLATSRGRRARVAEWQPIVSNWTKDRPVDEIVRAASELRIPVAPVNDAAHALLWPQFVERGVFVNDPEGQFQMPRRPWLLNGEAVPPVKKAPAVGEHKAMPRPRTRNVVLARSERSLPLAGVRVFDMTSWVAGPYASNLLGGLGADVIHVESTKHPDGIRMTGGLYAKQPDWWERGGMFLHLNTNKRGITLALDNPRGRALALRVISTCDIVLENFTPRVLNNLGLTFEELRRVNEQIILARMPAYGLSGPLQDAPAFAQTIEPAAGLAWQTGYADGDPLIMRGPSDVIAGGHAAFAILVALEERDRTGEAQHLEIPMVEASLNVGAEMFLEFTSYGRQLTREGNAAPHAAPQGLYACQGREQWLALSVLGDEHWQGLLRTLDSPAWALNDRYRTHSGRRQHRIEIDRRLSDWAATQDVEGAVARLLQNGVPAGQARDPRLEPDHPHLRSRGYFEDIEHPIVGCMPVPGLPFRVHSVKKWVNRPAPFLGQHTRDVLRELARVTDDELDDLEATNVIGSRPHGL